MARPFLTDESKAALADAVRAVEAASSAELVVAVRPRSGSYVHADLGVAIAAGLAALAFLFYSDWTFGWLWFLVDPVLAGALAGLVASRSHALRRLLTPYAARRRWVEMAARSTFLEKRVHATTGRTGVLLYISLLERDAVVVVDLGVEALAATDSWQDAVADLEETVYRGGTGLEVAAKIRDLAAVLSPALERSANDVDELPNEVC